VSTTVSEEELNAVSNAGNNPCMGGLKKQVKETKKIISSSGQNFQHHITTTLHYHKHPDQNTANITHTANNNNNSSNNNIQYVNELPQSS